MREATVVMGAKVFYTRVRRRSLQGSGLTWPNIDPDRDWSGQRATRRPESRDLLAKLPALDAPDAVSFVLPDVEPPSSPLLPHELITRQTEGDEDSADFQLVPETAVVATERTVLDGRHEVAALDIQIVEGQMRILCKEAWRWADVIVECRSPHSRSDCVMACRFNKRKTTYI